VPDGGEAAGEGRVVADLQADLGDARGVDPPQRAQGRDVIAAADGDLAALVHLQDLVPDLEQADAPRRLDALDSAP
jgi:hypothetical protein